MNRYLYNIYLRYLHREVPGRIVVSTPTPTTQWRSTFRILIQLNLSDGVRKKEYDDVFATAIAARKRPGYIYLYILLYNMFHSSGPVVLSDQKNNTVQKKNNNNKKNRI
jgi:hypothetical protein